MILSILKSRTVWTVTAMFVLAGLEGVREFIPTDLQPVVFGFISLLAVYFRLVPKQDYHTR